MTNISEILGTDGIKLRCLYTKDPDDQVSGINFLAENVSTETFINIAESSIFSPYTKLLPYGVYLFGSANISKLSDSQSEVVLTFNNLKCKHERNYKCTLSVHQAAPTDSAPMDIFVGVPPTKPEHVVVINSPMDVSTTTAKPSVSTPISSKNEPTLTSPGENTITTTPLYNFGSSPVDDDIPNTTLSYNKTVPKAKKEKSIIEDDNITFKCSGNVGKPAAIFIFQKLLEGLIQSTTYDVTTTTIEEFPGNCSYYRTSKLTFQVTAEDNNAVIRCVIVSPLAEENMFVDSEQIEVKYHVRIPTVTKYPDKHEYIAGVDSSITLTCTGYGNPKPIYHWYKDNHGDSISIAEKFTLMNINTTDRGLYTCYVSNTINGLTFTEVASIEVNITNEENEVKSATSKNNCSVQTSKIKKDNTSVIVVCAVSGSIILVLCVILFGVLQNKNKTLRCPHTVNCRNITETNVNTTQQHNSPYDGVGHVLDVHNYDELSTREHQYTNTNLMSS
ncbi:uncharacterized protein [Mytilus edulis]|uniref:uncharacterized protein n=1 Tax=Mytilus edulis TaxID=6550 RepID=UPI0039EE0E49